MSVPGRGGGGGRRGEEGGRQRKKEMEEEGESVSGGQRGIEIEIERQSR